jgi:hypothetical protein
LIGFQVSSFKESKFQGWDISETLRIKFSRAQGFNVTRSRFKNFRFLNSVSKGLKIKVPGFGCYLVSTNNIFLRFEGF